MTGSTPDESSLTSRGKIVILAILGAGLGAFFFFDLGRYFSLEVLQANRDHLLDYTNTHFATAVTLFIVIYIVQTGFSFPGKAGLHGLKPIAKFSLDPIP